MENKKWQFDVNGIPDEYFERVERIPMTKEEIRALSISKLKLKRTDSMFDIGSGSGSVSVEMSLIAGNEGQVTAFDMNQEAVELTRRNLSRISPYNNYTVLLANAKELPDVERVDAIFVGGGAEYMENIVRWCGEHSTHGFKVVVNAIQPESAVEAIRVMEKYGFEGTSMVQVSLASSRKTSTGHAMIARNPIYIIYGGKR